MGDDWPLIRYLLDDEVYAATYYSYLQSTSDMFDAAALTAKYSALAEAVAPYAAADEGAETFNTALATLYAAFETRDAALSDFLAGAAAQ